MNSKQQKRKQEHFLFNKEKQVVDDMCSRMPLCVVCLRGNGSCYEDSETGVELTGWNYVIIRFTSYWMIEWNGINCCGSDPCCGLQPDTARRASIRSSIMVSSVIVEMSPSSSISPRAILPSTRRNILPDLVLGSPRTAMMRSGVATGPMVWRTIKRLKKSFTN